MASERLITVHNVGFLFQREGCGKLEASVLLALISFLYCLRSATHLSDAPANRRVLEMAQSAVCTWAVIHGCNSCSLPHAALQLPPFLHHRLSPHPSITSRISSPDRPFVWNDIYVYEGCLGSAVCPDPPSLLVVYTWLLSRLGIIPVALIKCQL